jgi:midasin
MQDLAQLVLIVADGRLHEKEALRAAVRKLAAKRGVCLAFIAVDAPPAPAAAPAAIAESAATAPAAAGAVTASTPPANAAGGGSSSAANYSSLLDMQAVTFQGGRPVFKRYLDDFPFPYYVLLRDIGALPRTLADLLRQWFELSASGAGL